MDNLTVPESYYDVQNNRIFVRGIKYSSIENGKYLRYPGILPNIYCISEDGRVYSMMNDNYIEWEIRNNLPYVNLITTIEKSTTLEPYYIKDLMAYNYIANPMSYLERGLKVVNIDGDPLNCRYKNIIYINPAGI